MNTNDYAELLDGIKARVRAARLRAAAAANSELVQLYWNVGRDILKKQREQGWGAKVVDRLSGDLTREFPGMSGFSPRNLKYMLAFARIWPDEAIMQQAVALLPWGQNVAPSEPAPEILQ
jgi:predicted nuclease of restriction endonuclease-like (RecB) superfamily